VRRGSPTLARFDSGAAPLSDGVLQPSTTDVDVDATSGIIRKFQLTNQPNGLRGGTHAFVSVFIIEGVVVRTSTVTVDVV
jgi:hypothetical protein